MKEVTVDRSDQRVDYGWPERPRKPIVVELDAVLGVTITMPRKSMHLRDARELELAIHEVRLKKKARVEITQ